MTGSVLNIQRFSTDDGPGIRTTVFLKGCPLRCVWCHNPESQMGGVEIAYAEEGCRGCGRCVDVCSEGRHNMTGGHVFLREGCAACGRCAEACITGALEVYGKTLSVSDVLRVIERDRVFYDTSGGGATVSGGEPLFQPEFTAEILKACREKGIHTAIETSGFADRDALLSVLRYCDLVLFDIKESRDELHKRYTGVHLDPILDNLHAVNGQRIPLVIRAPIVPGLNDRAEHFDHLKKLASSLEYCRGIQIMPYHRTGEYKYRRLGREYTVGNIQAPDKETAQLWKKFVSPYIYR